MRRILYSLLAIALLALAACGDDPATTAPPKTTTRTLSTAAATGPVSPGPVKNTIRLMTDGLSPRAADAIKEGAALYFTEQKKDWEVQLTKPISAFNDNDAVNAIIIFGGSAGAPKLAPHAKYTPIVVIEPQADVPAGIFSVKSRSEGQILPPELITPQIIEDIKSGKTTPVAVTDYIELGHRAAQLAHTAIRQEGDLRGSGLTDNEIVSPIILNKANPTSPHLATFLQ